MTTPTNIVQFRPNDDLLADIDADTWHRIFEVAALEGITVDDVIDRACESFINEFKVGNFLLNHLEQLRSEEPRGAMAATIRRWKLRIQKILDGLGKDGEEIPPKNAA